MAGPTFNAAANSSLSSSTTQTATVTAAANDTIVAFVLNTTGNSGGSIAPTSVSDGTGYTPQDIWRTTAFNIGAQAFTLANASAGSHSVVVTFSSAVSCGIWVGCYSNAGGSVVDQATGAILATNTTFSQTLTNLSTNDTVISFAYGQSGVAVSSQSGTPRTLTGWGSASVVQDQVQAGSGAISPSFTWVSTQPGLMLALSLQNVSGGSNSGFFLLPQFRR